MNFQKRMSFWHTLAQYANEIPLKGSGLRLHIYDAGPKDAPAMLLVHGLGDESDSWRHIITPLALHQRVIALDLPGFGRSDPLQRYTIPAILRVLVELLDTLDIYDATFVGSSLGGMLCHAIAIEYPNRVRSLVLIDGYLGAKTQRLSLSTLLFMLPGIGEWQYNHYRQRPEAAYASLRPFYADLDSLPISDREFLYQRVNERVWSKRQRTAYLGVLRNTAVWMLKQQRNLGQNLKNLAVPTLIIYGEQDHIMPLDNTGALPDVQPSARLITLPGVGHLPQQEAPEKLLGILRNDPELRIKL